MTRSPARLGLVLLALAAFALSAPRPAVPAGSAVTVRDDFARDNPRWTFVAGQWGRRESGGRSVLAQTKETQPWAVALLEEAAFTDVDVSVRFRPISGKEDASGGIILRAKDGLNYYVVRANALENNFRLYTVIKGARRTLASARVREPKLGEWHTLRVTAERSRIQAWLDGKHELDHNDTTFTQGFIGLWTKADSVTEFADLQVTGTAAP
ncbi:MAG TPA: family 16 glycoside hydrolase [Methylomirabilota bacterium]|nr:family 16 glycoside hydrolase [Methylomirabilota bacterium]